MVASRGVRIHLWFDRTDDVNLLGKGSDVPKIALDIRFMRSRYMTVLSAIGELSRAASTPKHFGYR